MSHSQLLYFSEWQLASLHEQLFDTIDDLLNPLAEHLCTGILEADERGDILEYLILKCGELQASFRRVEGQILQEDGVGASLAMAQTASARAASVVARLEDLLMANLEGNIQVLHQSKSLRYQVCRLQTEA